MRAGRVLILSLVVAAGGCSGSEGARPTDTKAACERLRDLADEILTFQKDQSDAEKAAVRRAVEAFNDAAGESGDAELAEQAHMTLQGFRAYLEGRGIDAREAGYKANIAMDRAGKSCVESGSVRSLPTEPR